MADDPATIGWATVALFYAARDVAHAVFAEEPGLGDPFRHPRNHSSIDLNDPGTNFAIKRHFRAVEIPYMDLYATGTGVRYEGLTVDVGLYGDMMSDFREVAAWAHRRLTDAGRTYFPEWIAGE
jgi:hypothetical protein